LFETGSKVSFKEAVEACLVRRMDLLALEKYPFERNCLLRNDSYKFTGVFDGEVANGEINNGNNFGNEHA